LGLGPAASFLRCLIQPPPAKAVEAALAALQEVGAITVFPASADSAAAAAAFGNSTPSELSSGASSSSNMASLAGSTSAAAAAAARGWDEVHAEEHRAAAAAAGGVEVLTPLGRLLAVLPLEPRLGKLLVMGAALGCLAPALVSAEIGECFESCGRVCGKSLLRCRQECCWPYVAGWQGLQQKYPVRQVGKLPVMGHLHLGA
jgi:HrpA-like RNA helicase